MYDSENEIYFLSVVRVKKNFSLDGQIRLNRNAMRNCDTSSVAGA